MNGNEAWFANHSCDGNACVDIIRDHIRLIAEQDIDEGDEITFDYRFQADELYGCACGVNRCRGCMNDAEDDLVKMANGHGK